MSDGESALLFLNFILQMLVTYGSVDSYLA